MEKCINSSDVVLEEKTIDQAPSDELTSAERLDSHCQLASAQSSPHPKDAPSLSSSKSSSVTEMVDNVNTSQTATKDVNQNVVDCPENTESCNDQCIDSSRMPDGNNDLSSNTPVANTQESVLERITISHGDGSEELVDVRVCDICGDAGRDALLALCSFCSDGAEHIYCMRNKMDEVPVNGWMCEECNGMQEQKGPPQVDPSCLIDKSQPLINTCPVVHETGEPSTKHSSKGIKLSGKKRTSEELSQPSRRTKTKMTRVSSIKSIDKRIDDITRMATPKESTNIKSKKNIPNKNSVWLSHVSKSKVLKCGSSKNENVEEESSSSRAQEGKKQVNVSGISAGEKWVHPLKPTSTLDPSKKARESSSVPAAECIWKGGFKLEKSGKLPSYYGGIQAHLPNHASSESYEIVSKFGPKLLFKELPSSETWRSYFRRNSPTEEDIAFYFFAKDIQSYKICYKILLDGMMNKDLILEADVDGVQLLVFPSSVLPTTSQRWNSLYYLWGVCRAKKDDDNNRHLPSMNAETLNAESTNKRVSTLEGGNLLTFPTLQNSIQGPNAVYLLLLNSSALTISNGQSCDHDTASEKCVWERDSTKMQHGTIQSVYDLNEATFICRELHTDGKLKGIQSDDQHTEFTPKRENMAQPLIYNHPCDSSRLEIASRSSFSFDSGPSWSSDGCARSDREQSEKPTCSSTLNLDLSLRFNSQTTEEDVDLNLTLGFPWSTNQSRHFTGRNVSLNLSLGLP